MSLCHLGGGRDAGCVDGADRLGAARGIPDSSVAPAGCNVQHILSCSLSLNRRETLQGGVEMRRQRGQSHSVFVLNAKAERFVCLFAFFRSINHHTLGPPPADPWFAPSRYPRTGLF